ncbi:MAG: toprim domain-containing protein [Oscillospiraceae bacterium]|nr:toprim domain-containing protein [Oscillospiraceae bacterium]
MELEAIKQMLPDYLARISVRERTGLYHCPLCGSGTHRGAQSTGAFSVYNNNTQWHCFACNESGDIFSLIGLVEHLDTFPQQLQFASELFGIPLPDSGKNHEKKQPPAKSPAPSPAPAAAEPQHDFHAYITACMQDVSKTDYWTKVRGFSPEVIRRFHLGYDKEKQVVVIPYDSGHTYYLTRSIRGKSFRKPNVQNAGTEPIYHKDALYQNRYPCFVCESPIDAISIMSAGDFQAVAVGGTGSRKLIQQFEQKKPLCPLILSFDADDAGRKASAVLADELRKLGIPFTEADYDLTAFAEDLRKDPNDFFRSDAAAFARQLAQNADAVMRSVHADRDESRRSNETCTGAFRLAGFLDSIHGAKAQEAIATGFADLDKALDGGLFAGLYILGAVSSLGKTTFLLQMADQIAAGGTDVLYFSLEMSANELIAKSVSRQTYQLCGGDVKMAKTVRGITTKSRYPGYSGAEWKLIDQAVLAYQKYADKLYYYEGIGDLGVREIRQKTEEHMRLTGRTPVVMIDYLQIMAPYDMRASDKQNTDKAILELKRMSRDCGLPVFVISSLNRESYSIGEIEMRAFKESGAIEYGSDVLMGLQVQGMDEKQDNQKKIAQEKQHAIRNVEVKILKNRNGQTGDKIGLRYYALFNCFERDEQYVCNQIIGSIRTDDFEPAR